jgi:nucleotide-binding universal stress UspA family protein
MGSLSFVIAVAAVWIVIGLVLSLVMARRGHNATVWLALGTLMGPLAVVFAFDSTGHEHMRPTVLDQPAPGPTIGYGPVDVLIGFDGSAESAPAAQTVVELLGPRLGRLTIATVVPYDGGREAERMAIAALERQSGRIGGFVPQVEVLHGRPAAALSLRAAEAGYDLLVVGTRGAGLTKAILGSAAVALSHDSKVPVLLAGGGH